MSYLQVRTLLDRVYALSKTWNDAPVIICGDFNSTPKAIFSTLPFYIKDSYLVHCISWTFYYMLTCNKVKMSDPFLPHSEPSVQFYAGAKGKECSVLTWKWLFLRNWNSHNIIIMQLNLSGLVKSNISGQQTSTAQGLYTGPNTARWTFCFIRDTLFWQFFLHILT